MLQYAPKKLCGPSGCADMKKPEDKIHSISKVTCTLIRLHLTFTGILCWPKRIKRSKYGNEANSGYQCWYCGNCKTSGKMPRLIRAFIYA